MGIGIVLCVRVLSLRISVDRAMARKLKFAANLHWLFKEHEHFADRYAAAAKAGFLYVESADVSSLPLEELVEAKTKSKINHVLMNSMPG